MSSKKSTPKLTPKPAKRIDTLLVGHEDVRVRFRESIKRGRLAHAYLFVGPAGIGKRRFALHLAQSLLCETRAKEELDPCGVCAACAQVAACSHPDLLQVGKPEDKNELPIAVIQDLVGQLALKPARGHHKIAIVDDADDLNEESANCFLKTLEEPPAGSILILIARAQETQLQTIQSRCQIIRFRELADADVARLLTEIEITPDPVEAKRLARRGEGSVARAIELSLPEWVEMENFLTTELVRVPINVVGLAEKINQFVEDAGKESAPKRTRARQVVGMVARTWRDLLHLSVAADTPAESERSIAAGRLGPDILTDLLDRTLDADYHIARMASLPLAVETWIDDLGRIASGRYLAPIR